MTVPRGSDDIPEALAGSDGSSRGQTMFSFDHLAICCTDLEAGVSAVEAALGVGLDPGGRHPHFGTHNRLLSLGPEEYLEVIAIDPEAPPPGRPRWFGLDTFSGPPRPASWILRCKDLDAARDRLGSGIGPGVSLSRGDYRWQMAVPESGILPLDGLHPAVIRWEGPHPAAALPPRGCRLAELVLSHPRVGDLARRLGLEDSRIRLETGPPGLSALIKTPGGPRRLG